MATKGIRALVLAAAIVSSLLVVAPASPAGGGGRTLQAANVLERDVLAKLNEIRAEHGLAPLKLNSRLRTAADTHSAAMATHGFFAHESRDGTAFWKRVQRYYGPRGYAMWSVGENLLWSSGDLTADQAVEMWMNSPKHRENILTARWREIGLSAVRVPAAPGIFSGLDVTVFTTDFGVRRSS